MRETARERERETAKFLKRILEPLPTTEKTKL